MPRTLWVSVATMGVFLTACRSPATEDRTAANQRSAGQEVTTSPQEEPNTTPPADVSHGEAKIGGPKSEPAPVVAQLAPAKRIRLHKIRLEMSHAPVTVAPGVQYAAWTFGGTVPGPVLRVGQGDTVEFTLINRADIPHSMDFHAAEVAPSKKYVNVMPGDSLKYRFVPRVPGAFMYHCGTAPVAMHIANGMYGAIIVDPSRPLPKARELVFVQSEFYMTPKPAPDGTRSLQWDKLLSLAPDHVVFNGRADQYASHPVDVQPMELLRLYVVNAGPNRISSFHVVGGMFDRVYEGSQSAAPTIGVQTMNIPVGGGSIFELRLREPGDYPFVTHAFADATKGGVGVLRVLEPGQAPSQQASSMKH